MSSSRSQKKSGISWMRKERKRDIKRSGVLRPTSIDRMKCGKGSTWMNMNRTCHMAKVLDKNG